MFEKQSKKYKKSVLCNRYSNTITLEMLSTYGWGKYGKHNIGIDAFGKSGNDKEVIEAMNFDFVSVYSKIKNIIH
jgi:transketolase